MHNEQINQIFYTIVRVPVLTFSMFERSRAAHILGGILMWGIHFSGETDHRLLLCLHTCEATDRFPSEDLGVKQLFWHGCSLSSGTETCMLPWNPEMPANPLEAFIQHCWRSIISNVHVQGCYRSQFCLFADYSMTIYKIYDVHNMSL